MTYITYQGNDSDCGFASLKMLMANKTKNKSYLYISKGFKKKDYSFYDLSKIAKGYGFIMSSYEIPREDVQMIENGSLALINENHLVYVNKVKKRFIIYIDPALGKVKTSLKEFEKIFTGKVMECVNYQDARVVRDKPVKISPIYQDIIYYVLVGAVFASLMAGFYLIKESSSIILTMVFLLLFAIGELVENWYIINQLKLFDNRFMPKFFSRKRNQKIEKYRDYTDYKTKYFIVAKTLVSNLIMIAAFSALLCINDYRNLFAFLILLIIRLFDNLLFAKQEKNDVGSIEKQEAAAFLDEKKLLDNLSKANSTARKIALRVSIRKIVYLFISLCLALGLMIVSNVTSSNFIIFHLGIYFLMSEAFDGLIRYFSSFRDRKIKKARFLDDCDL